MFKKKQQQTGSINLLRRMEKGISDKFLIWSFTVGRAILMIVYAVALGAFLYRFGLDREIIDLKDKIENEQKIVEASAANEAKYRDLQEKLLFIKLTSARAEEETVVLDKIINLATRRIVFNSMQITPEKVDMEGSVRSIGSLNAFVDDVKKLPQITTVTLNKLESRVDQGIIAFSLTAERKQ